MLSQDITDRDVKTIFNKTGNSFMVQSLSLPTKMIITWYISICVVYLYFLKYFNVFSHSIIVYRNFFGLYIQLFL